MSEFLAALCGALVGGAITGAIAIWQTKTTLDHSARLARDAAVGELEASRDAARRQTAMAMLDSLATYATPVGRHAELRWFGGGMTQSERLRLELRIADLERHVVASLPLLDQEVASRWRELVRLARALNGEGTIAPPHFARSRGDLRNYADYVHRSLTSVLDGSPYPPSAPGPNLGRDDPRVWGHRPPPDSLEPDITAWRELDSDRV